MKQMITSIKIAMKSLLRRNIGNKLLLLCMIILFLIPVFLYNTTSEITSSLKEQQKMVYGTFNDIYYRDTTSEFEQVYTSDINELLPFYEYDNYGVFYTVEKQELEGNRLLNLGYADDTALELGGVTLDKGRYPQSDDEIALTKGVADAIKVSAVGETVKIGAKTFTLCGLVNDFGRLWPRGEIQDRDKITPVNAFITSERAKSISEENGFGVTEQILLKSPDGVLNSADSVSLFENTNNADSKTYYSVPNSFMLIMYLVSLMIIISLLILNRKNLIKRAQNYYLLGMQKKRIKALISFELIFLSFTGIIVGCFLGLIATKICVYCLIGEKAPIHLEFNSIKLIVGSILAIIVIISAYTGSVISDVELESNKHSSFFHFKDENRVSFFKYDFRHNLKTLAAAALLISMACVLVSYGVAYKNYYVEDVTELADGYIQRDYDFQVVSDYISAPPLSTDPETGEELFPVMFTNNYDKNGADDELIDSIQKLQGVKKIKAYKENQSMNLLLKQDQVDKYIDGSDAYIDDTYDMQQTSDIVDFELIYDKFGYDNDDIIISSEIVGYSDDLLKSLSPYVAEGEINVDKLRSGEEIILRAPAYKLTTENIGGLECIGLIPTDYNDPDAINVSSLKVGDEITLTGILTDEDYNGGIIEKDLDSFQRKDVTVKIGAIIRSYEGVLPSSKIGASFSFLTTNDAFETLGVPTKYSTLSIYTDNNADNAKIAEDISELCLKYPKMTFENWSSDIESYKIYNMLVRLFTVTFIVILIISSLALLSSQLYIKTMMSSSSYSLYRLNGLSFGMLFRSLWLQNIIIYVIGAVISYPITKLLIKISMQISDLKSVSIYLPNKAQIIVILSVLLILVVSYIPSMICIFKQKDNILRYIRQT